MLKRSTQLEIPFKAAFVGTQHERMDALQQMVAHPEAEVNMLLLYAKAFNIETNTTLTLFSSALLRRMEPCLDVEGASLVAVNNLSELKTKLAEVWARFSAPEALLQHLLSVSQVVFGKY